MPTCVQQLTFYAYPDSTGSSALVAVNALMPVAADPASCPALVLSGTDYADLTAVSATRITDQATAEVIAGALIVLFAVAAGVKAVRHVLMDSDVSDEKH